MSESTSNFETVIRVVLDRETPSNTIIETERGIGTFALLKSLLSEVSANTIAIDGRQLDILSKRLPDGRLAVYEEFNAIDTLIIDEAASMKLALSRPLREIVQERTIHGLALPNLKRVFLVYSDLGETEGWEFLMDTGSRYALVRVLRALPSDTSVANPVRTVTIEAEYAALPIGSVIRGNRHGEVAERVNEEDEGYRWVYTGSNEGAFQHMTIARNLGEATVLFTP
jgi:hypothetical protein